MPGKGDFEMLVLEDFEMLFRDDFEMLGRDDFEMSNKDNLRTLDLTSADLLFAKDWFPSSARKK